MIAPLPLPKTFFLLHSSPLRCVHLLFLFYIPWLFIYTFSWLIFVCPVLGRMGKKSHNRNSYPFFSNVVNGHEIAGLVLNPLVNQKDLLQMLQVLLSGKLEYVQHCSSRDKSSFNLKCRIHDVLLENMLLILKRPHYYWKVKLIKSQPQTNM